jgi:methylenetetrahydrofolate dehydrogenase (NADP+)/methenyltetrahydrofolate cyclohydrolase
MSARRIDGRAVADEIQAQVAQEVKAITEAGGPTPRLDVVLVGDDPGSQVYVRRKTEAAGRVGIHGETRRLAADATQATVLKQIEALNIDPRVHGILLQLPLPRQLDKGALLDRIAPAKDVDCFHPQNVGLMLIGRAPMPPPTPQAVVEILDHTGVRLEGAEVVIVNHSNLIGKPLASLLINRDATVAVCHKATRDLKGHTRRADVLISGAGVQGLITRDHVRPGAVVVDVGFARTPEGKLCGDVDTEDVAEVASAITPVPGGVGPVTVAMLLRNVTTACRLQWREAEATH